MPKHRTLSNAMLSPEKLAFIKGEEPDRANRNTEKTQEDSSCADVSNETRPRDSETIATTKPSKIPSTQTQQSVPTAATALDDSDYRVAITTRLTPPTADALRRAHLERKLHRRKATQQEIVEAALQHWLREHAYLD